MAWIETVEPDRAEGILKEEYEAALARAGKIFNVVRISSLRPEILRSWIDLYKVLMHGRAKMSRRQREMIAIVVSAINHCFY